MSVLYIRNGSGDFVPIYTIKGDKGDKGDAGSVTAVNGISPDGSGNVKLGAVHPRNLLDNSDFTNPVNQRGQSSYTNGGYCIDRWRTGMASGTTAYAVGGVLWLGKGYGQFVQELIDHHIGEALIFAIYLSDVSSEDIIAIVNDGYSQSATPVHRGLNIVTHTVRADATTLYVGLQNNDQSSDQRCTPVWAALYEGTYTADTLPPYVPKGYAAELAECMRYFERIGYTAVSGVPQASVLLAVGTNGEMRLLQGYKVPKRSVPSVMLNGRNPGETVSVRCTTDGSSCAGVFSMWNNSFVDRLNTITIQGTSVIGKVYEGFLDISADL